MNYFKMNKYDATNWEGINASIFFSGCDFECPGCFNSDIWSFDAGKVFDVAAMEQFISYAKDPKVDGVCILGGEPFQQDLLKIAVLLDLLKQDVGKPIHVWSGYTYEELIDLGYSYMLENVDTLVDGKFVIELKDLNLKNRGSSNQRVIDVQESLKKGEVVLYPC